MAKIAVIGAGELGQALGSILAEGNKLVYWDKDENKIEKLKLAPLSLPEVMLSADFVFLCVPSGSVKEALAYMRPYWSRNSIAIMLSKGIDYQTGKLPYEIARKLLPPRIGLVVMSGAMIAEEIGSGHFGAALTASTTSANAKVAELFYGTNLLVLPTNDIRGVIWSGILKNIYTLGMGITEGLGWTINERGLLFSQSIEEILRLIKIFGGKAETFLAVPTLADFVSSSFDCNSLNHEAGVELGRTGYTEKISEGLVSLPSVLERLGDKIKNFSVLTNLARVIIDHENPKKVFNVSH